MKALRRDLDLATGGKPCLSEPLLFLDLSHLHPVPERLCDIFLAAKKRGCAGVVVNWGGSFPWTVNRSMRNEFAFPEEVIAGIAAFTARAGISLIPYLPPPDRMGFARSTDCRSFFEGDPRTPALLDPSRPGVLSFIKAVLADQLELLPNAPFFAADCSAAPEKRNILRDSLREFAVSRGIGLVTRIGGTWRYDATPQDDAESGKPTETDGSDLTALCDPQGEPFVFSDPAAWDRLLGILGLDGEAPPELDGFRKRGSAAFHDLDSILATIWATLRETKEALLMISQGIPCLDYRRILLAARSAAIEALTDEAEARSADVYDAYRQIFPPDMLFRYLFSLVEAAREETAAIVRKIRQALPLSPESGASIDCFSSPETGEEP